MEYFKIVGSNKWSKVRRTKRVPLSLLRLFKGTQVRGKVSLMSSENKLGFEIGDLITTVSLNHLRDFMSGSGFSCIVFNA